MCHKILRPRPVHRPDGVADVVGRYGQPVPLAEDARRARAAFLRPDVSSTQVITTIVIIVASILTVGPRGWTGRGLAVMLLLVVNCLFLASRHLPTKLIKIWAEPAGFVVALLAAAAFFSLSNGGLTSAFGFFVAGHAGYRLARDQAIFIAVLCSVACGGVLLFRIGPGHAHIPWYVGAATGFAVTLGMINRSRQDALDSARAAAAQAERASQAEARELILAERGRIARDVHDLLAHSLAGINMQLEMADALLEQGETEPARLATQRAQSIARESLGEAQRTVRALREDNLPLAETLAAMAEADDRIDTLQVTGTVREVDTSTAQALIRAAQESLTNAHKHAPGAPVELRLSYLDEAVQLDIHNQKSTVADRPLAEKGSGMGLLGMRERTAMLGGRATAAPTQDGGWLVSVRIPTGGSQ